MCVHLRLKIKTIKDIRQACIVDCEGAEKGDVPPRVTGESDGHRLLSGDYLSVGPAET